MTTCFYCSCKMEWVNTSDQEDKYYEVEIPVVLRCLGCKATAVFISNERGD